MMITLEELKKIAYAPYSIKFMPHAYQIYTDAFIRNLSEVEVPDTIYRDAELAEFEYNKEAELQERRDKEYSRVSELRLSGMAKEKDSDNEGAISEYVLCIESGEHSEFRLFTAYAYAYERIIICLHKSKDYLREAEYIKRFLSYDIGEDKSKKYLERLNKLKLKIKQ